MIGWLIDWWNNFEFNICNFSNFRQRCNVSWKKKKINYQMAFDRRAGCHARDRKALIKHIFTNIIIWHFISVGEIFRCENSNSELCGLKKTSTQISSKLPISCCTRKFCWSNFSSTPSKRYLWFFFDYLTLKNKRWIEMFEKNRLEMNWIFNENVSKKFKKWIMIYVAKLHRSGRQPGRHGCLITIF